MIIEQLPAGPTAEELKRDSVHDAERAKDLADRESENHRRALIDTVTIGVGVATILILIVQAAAFFIQAQQLQRSVEEMKAGTAVAKAAADIAKASVDASIDANRLNREALLAEHRPWLKFAITAVHFLRYGPSGWELKFSYELKNIGKNPAFKADIQADMIPRVLASWPADKVQGNDDLVKMQAEATDVTAELRRFSREMLAGASSSTSFGTLLFPDDRLQNTYQINRADQPFTEQLGRIGYAGQFVLLSGAVYKFAADQSWHETTMAFSLYRVGGGRSMRIELVSGHFEAGLGQLEVYPDPIADSYAT